MTKEEFQKHLDNATRIVESWPEWKRTAIRAYIENSPTVSTPRPHVNNNND